MIMQQIISSENIQTTFAPEAYLQKDTGAGIFKRFFKWCATQDDNKFLWLGVSLFGFIGGVVPLTLLSILYFADNNFTLWLIVCSVNVPVLALNLAAQPAKITLPTLFFSLLVNAAVIAFCFITFLIH